MLRPGHVKVHVSPLLASFCANRHLFSSLHLLSSVLHSFYNIDVTSTTTEVAGDAHANLVFGRVGIAPQESQAGHHHARCAIAALQRVFLVETLLQWVQFATLFQPFYSHNLTTISLHSEHGARFRGLAIHQDSTRAA